MDAVRKATHRGVDVHEGEGVHWRGTIAKAAWRKYGHNLVKLVEAVEAMHEPILKTGVRAELKVLSSLYSQHLLRYGSGYDVLVNPNTIPSERVLSRVAALLRVAERKGINHEQAI